MLIRLQGLLGTCRIGGNILQGDLEGGQDTVVVGPFKNSVRALCPVPTRGVPFSRQALTYLGGCDPHTEEYGDNAA